jgi:hypothetical protein
VVPVELYSEDATEEEEGFFSAESSIAVSAMFAKLLGEIS